MLGRLTYNPSYFFFYLLVPSKINRVRETIRENLRLYSSQNLQGVLWKGVLTLKKNILFGSGVCVLGGACLFVGWIFGLATACAIEADSPDVRLIDLFYE